MRSVATRQATVPRPLPAGLCADRFRASLHTYMLTEWSHAGRRQEDEP